MEWLILALFVLPFVLIYVFYKMLLKAEGPSEETETPVVNYRATRRHQQQKEHDDWEEDFLRNLPPKDHPDYIQYDPKDTLVSEEELKTFTDELVATHRIYQKGGRYYRLNLDYLSGRVTIHRNKFSQTITDDYTEHHPFWAFKPEMQTYRRTPMDPHLTDDRIRQADELRKLKERFNIESTPKT